MPRVPPPNISENTPPLAASPTALTHLDDELGRAHPQEQHREHANWNDHHMLHDLHLPHLNLPHPHLENLIHPGRKLSIWHRFRGKNRGQIPGAVESLKAIAMSSWLNVFLLIIPIAWAAHFQSIGDGHKWSPNWTFALCFLSMIPLESLFDFGGEQMALYCGAQVGDLVVVTLNNSVEATLAILLVRKCELKLLQSTISGVILLHLLLIPGTAFLTGGARVWHQHLHPHVTELNQTLLTLGILSLLIPPAFFAALNPSVTETSGDVGGKPLPFLSDSLRGEFLKFSRGLAVILLIVYVCSRFFLLNPPGENNALVVPVDAPIALHEKERELEEETPKVNPWVCIAFLMVTVAIMAVTAEFFVESIDSVRENSNITEEWFGIILLPLISFSGDAVVAIVYFLKTALFLRPETPEMLAKARAIDMSIQFTLFWMPFLVLLAWWIGKPLTLLFDLYEVAILIGACFLVNYVTADAKTNWAEGVMLCALYIMIALVSWYYPGQNSVSVLLDCRSVTSALTSGGGAE